jgi:anionic glutamate receptor
MRPSCVLGVLLLTVGTIAGRSSVEEERSIVQALFAGYDREMRPGSAESQDGPIEVQANMFIRNLESVDLKKQDFTVDVTFRQQWLDQRLKFKSSNVSYLTLPHEEMIWIPDTFFRNAKEETFQLVPNKQFYVRVFPDGKILYSLRLTLKLHCGMNLKDFLSETQQCNIHIASYGHTKKTLYYTWKESSPVQMSSAHHTHTVEISHHDTSYCDVRTATGEYSCLSVDLSMKSLSSALHSLCD